MLLQSISPLQRSGALQVVIQPSVPQSTDLDEIGDASPDNDFMKAAGALRGNDVRVDTGASHASEMGNLGELTKLEEALEIGKSDASLGTQM